MRTNCRCQIEDDVKPPLDISSTKTMVPPPPESLLLPPRELPRLSSVKELQNPPLTIPWVLSADPSELGFAFGHKSWNCPLGSSEKFLEEIIKRTNPDTEALVIGDADRFLGPRNVQQALTELKERAGRWRRGPAKHPPGPDHATRIPPSSGDADALAVNDFQQPSSNAFCQKKSLPPTPEQDPRYLRCWEYRFGLHADPVKNKSLPLDPAAAVAARNPLFCPEFPSGEFPFAERDVLTGVLDAETGRNVRTLLQWIFVGEPGSGSPEHVDPLGSSAWMYLRSPVGLNEFPGMPGKGGGDQQG